MPLKYETITLPIPLAGLNTKDAPTLMNRLQSPDMQNVEIERVVIKKRSGYSQFGTGTISGTGMELIQYVDGQGTIHLIALTTTKAYHYNSSTNAWDDITPVAGDFTGEDTDRWSHTVATNLSEFTNNGGTALIISNGKDGLFKFEGQTSDKFLALTPSSDLTGFNFANEVEAFWNHLFLLNYNAAGGGIDFVRNAAFHDAPTDTYANLGITEVILSDSQGQIRRVKKLGYDMIVYSDLSITICRRVGGSTLFIFPTVIYSSGLFAEKGIWDSVNRHFFLGTDQKIYGYTGGTQLIPIAELVEDTFFSAVDPSKTPYIVTGEDPVKHKVHFFYPRTSDNYAKSFYSYNFDKEPKSWEKGILADDVADYSVFSNIVTWTFDGPQVAGKNFDDAEFATTNFDDGEVIGGYQQTVFLARSGGIFKLTNSAKDDNGTDIEAWCTTPDLVPVEGRTDEEGRFGGYNFSAKCTVAGSTLLVSYSTDGGTTWTNMDTINLTTSWVQYRVPVDVKTKKIRFRIYQNSAKDFQIRSQSYKVQVATDK